MSSDAPIVVEVEDKIPDGPAKKLVALAEAAERAHTGIAKLNAEMKGLDAKGVRALQTASTQAETATLRVATAQERLKAATERTQTAVARTAAAQSKAAAELAKAENVGLAFAQTTDRLRIAQDRLTLAKERAAGATRKLTADEKAAAAAQAAIARERTRQAQIASQADFNSVLGVGRPAANSARASAEVFKAAFAEQRAAEALSKQQDRAAQAALRHSAASAVLARQSGLTAFQMLTLQYTVNDVAASLASGASIGTILAQQGGQVAQAWGGVGNLFRAMGGALLTPVGAAVALTSALIGVAFYVDNARGKFRQLELDLQSTGNYAGLTTSAFTQMADRVSVATGQTVSSAREVALELAKSGQFQREDIEKMSVVTLNLSRITQRSTADITRDFIRAGEGPTQYARSLQILSAEQYAHIKRLEETGNKTQALRVLSEALYNYYGNEAPKSLSNLIGGWRDLVFYVDKYATALSEAATANIRFSGKREDLERKRLELVNSQWYMGASAATSEAIAALDRQIAMTRVLSQQKEREAAAQGKTTQEAERGKAALDGLARISSSVADNAARAAEKISEFRKYLADAGKTTPNDPAYLDAFKNRAAIEQGIRNQYMPKAAQAARVATAEEEKYEHVLNKVNAELSGEAKLIGLVAEARSRQQKINEIENRFLRTKRELTGQDRIAVLAQVDANIAEERAQAALQSAYSSIAGPMLNYAAQQQAINRLSREGKITAEEATRQTVVNREAYLNSADPMREIVRQLENEKQVTAAVGMEKAVLSRYLQAEQTLLARGIDLKAQENAAEREKVKNLIATQLAQEKLNSIVESYRASTVGALEDIRVKQEALTQAYGRGYVGADLYRSGLVQLNAEAARINIAQGIGTQVDTAMSAFGRMLEGYRGLHAGMADITGNFLTTTTDRFANAVGQWVSQGGSLAEVLGQAARQGIGEMVSGLVKLGLQWVVMQTLGQTLAATSAATTMTTAAATAAAWAPAAAMASLATLGTNAVPAGAALVTTVALSEMLALVGMGGFSEGGYTGNVARDRVAGVVHGQEFVNNAASTRRYRPILEAMNSGAGPQAVAKTAAQTAGGVGGVALHVTIEDHTAGTHFEIQQLSETDIRVIARQEVNKHADSAVSRAVADPNSKTSRSLARSTRTQRAY